MIPCVQAITLSIILKWLVVKFERKITIYCSTYIPTTKLTHYYYVVDLDYEQLKNVIFVIYMNQ